MVDAYLNDPDVVEAMAKTPPPKPQRPSLFGWTAELSALRDLCDQMIAQRGGATFVPRPEIPGHTERQRRKDAALLGTVARIAGSD